MARLAAGVATALCLAVALWATPSFATVYTWDGGGNNPIWGGARNWDPDYEEGMGTDNTAFFGIAFANGYDITRNVNWPIGHIIFTDPANANDMTLVKHTNDYPLNFSVTSGFPSIDVTQSERSLTIYCNVTSNAGLAITGPGTVIIAGEATYTGETFIDAGTLVLAGSPTGLSDMTVNTGATLRLDYSTLDTGKINDAAVLTLAGGTLDLAGGTHTEIVASTTLAAGVTSRVTSSIPGAVLQMGDITSNMVGSAVDFGASGIATTNNTNTNGILGPWETVAGADWAINSTDGANGLITAYAAYTDVQRLTPGTIADGAASNVRLLQGSGSAGNITLGAATTTINTINQSAVGGSSDATIDPAGQALLTNAILVGTGAGALTIGTGTDNGTLSAATPGGDLVLINNTANALTIHSDIVDNATSGLIKTGSGPLTLTGANSYAGPTTVCGGTVDVNGSLASQSVNVNAGTVNVNGSLSSQSVNVNGGEMNLNTAWTGNAMTVNGGTLNANSSLGTSTITVNGGNLNLSNVWTGDTLTVSGGATVLGGGATVSTADFSAGTGNVDATNALTVTGTLKLPNTVTATYTSGGSATGFTISNPAGGDIVTDTNRTVTLSGGKLSLTSSQLYVPTGADAYFAFDDSSNLALDSTGNYTAFSTAGSPGSVSGSFGSAMSVDGSDGNDGITAPNSTGNFSNATSEKTWSVWVNTTAGAGENRLIFDEGGATNGIALMLQDGKPAGVIAYGSDVSGGVDPVYATQAINDGNWHNIVLVYDGTNTSLSLYVDGDTATPAAQDKTVYSTVPAHSDGPGIGLENGSTGWQPANEDDSLGFIGMIDEVGVWERAITLQEVQDIYAQVISSGSLPGTAIHVTAASELEFTGPATLGALMLDDNLTLSGAGTSVSFTGITGSATLDAATAKSVTLDVADGQTASFSGVLADGVGVLGLAKTGSGTQVLSGSNTYTGTTTISAGTLFFEKQTAMNGGAAGFTSSNLTVESGATLGLAVGDSAGGYFDDTDIATILDASHLGASTTTTGMTAGSRLGLDTTNASGEQFTCTAAISDLGGNAIGLAKLGAGTLVLDAANTYSGTTTIYAGTLTAGAGQTSAFGSAPAIAFSAGSTGTLQLNGNNVTVNSLTTDGGTPTVENGAAADATLTLNAGGTTLDVLLQDGLGGGKLSLVKTGGGTFVLSNAGNSYSGGTTITGGTLDGGNFGTGTLTLDGATWDHPTANTNPVVVTANDATILIRSGGPSDPTALNGPISGDGGLTLRVPDVNNDVVITQINAACTYAGDTLLTNSDARAGFRIGVDNALPVTTVLTLQGDSTGSGRPTWFDLNGYSQELAGISQLTRNDSAIVNGTPGQDGALIVSNSADMTYSAYLGATNAHGNITQGTPDASATGIPEGEGDNFSLTKTGIGTLTLTANNTYTGDTIVEDGMLSITNAYLADAADVYVTSGAMFDLNFTGTDIIDELFFDGVAQSSGTWGAPGSGADYTSDLLSGTGWLSVTTSGILPGDANNDGVVDAADYILVKQNFGNTGGALNEDGDVTGDGNVTIADIQMVALNIGNTAAAAVTPEPAMLALLAFGGLAVVRRRRRSQVLARRS